MDLRELYSDAISGQDNYTPLNISMEHSLMNFLLNNESIEEKQDLISELAKILIDTEVMMRYYR
jgi:hypothetical protein